MPYDESEALRQKIIGLGESSVRKSYYPQLQDRLMELERFHALLDRSRELIVMLEAHTTTIIDANLSAAELFETPREHLVGAPLGGIAPEALMHKIELLKTKGEVEGCCILEVVMAKNKGDVPIEFVLQRATFGGVEYIIVLGKDITERKRAQQQIHHLAFYDPLTHLANRALLLDRLEQALLKSQRYGKWGALMMIDLDNFKALNDTKGHDRGDELLKEAAVRIGSLLNEGDTLARVGGDEFVVLLEALGATHEEAYAAIESFAQRLKHTLNQPYTLYKEEHTISSSMGVVFFSEEAHSKEEVLKEADIAMYQAKEQGRNRICYYDPHMQESIVHKTTLEHALRLALQREELTLFYQPQVDAKGALIGLEALVRWNHPNNGLMAPGQFIPLAEATGLIVSLGEWVLDRALAQLCHWQSHFLKQGIHVAINVSAKQFLEPTFYESVARCVRKHGVDPRLVMLELTESLIVENITHTIAKIEAIRMLGIGFSLDDFGTGYSSLSYLKRLPLDELKIDQSFVRDITIDNNDAMIVKTIIAMAHNFDLHVIAEGVESEAQYSFLRHNGCERFQGYLFGKPMPPEEIERIYM